MCCVEARRWEMKPWQFRCLSPQWHYPKTSGKNVCPWSPQQAALGEPQCRLSLKSWSSVFPLCLGSLELAGLSFPLLSSKERFLVLCPCFSTCFFTAQVSGPFFTCARKPVSQWGQAVDRVSAGPETHLPGPRFPTLTFAGTSAGLPRFRILMDNLMETLEEIWTVLIQTAIFSKASMYNFFLMKGKLYFKIMIHQVYQW